MNLTKLFLTIALTLIGGTMVFATDLLTIRDAKASDVNALMATWTTELGSADTTNKIEYCAAQGFVYIRANENATYAEARAKVLAKAKELGIEKEVTASTYMYGIVHPWWVGETRTALVQEALVYAEANPPVDGSSIYVELGRLYAFVMKDYTKGISAFEKCGKRVQEDMIDCYFEMNEPTKAIDTYYKLAEDGDIYPSTAEKRFDKVWSAQVRGFKSATERDEAKFRLSKLVDQYTNKLYSDSNVKPENSPWRKVITLWTASSK